MRITEQNKNDFIKLDDFDFDYNYYKLGRNVTDILEELQIINSSLLKWMQINNKVKRTKKDRMQAVKTSKILRLSKTITKDQITKAYIEDQQSILSLVSIYNVNYSNIYSLLQYYNIPIRTIKDAVNLDSCRSKYKNTCKQKYGEGIINVSQAKEVKEKKASTFIKHYGVDNIRKLPEYYIELDKFMLENYGQKRITNAEKISESRLALFEENEERAQELRLFYSDLAKNTWKNMSPKDQEEKMLNMRKSIPKEYYSSQLEYRIKAILDKNLIWNTHQFFMGKHSWDLFLGNKLLLEVNGDFWHANPKQYKANDVLSHRGGEVRAKDIWDIDQKKQKYAIERGFKVFYMWESDINEYSNKEILNIIKEQINENKISKENRP